MGYQIGVLAMTKLFKACVVGFVVVGMTGCAIRGNNLPPETTDAAAPSVLVESYKMSVADTISIVVWKNPELSVQAPIRPDGKISVPLIGDVIAAGKEPQELADLVTDKLGQYVRNPNVTVVITGLQGQAFLSRIRVTGAVGNDLSVPYQQGMTVLDAVLEAGSVDLYADANGTKLHRKTDDGTVTYDIRLKDIMEDGDMRTNVYLMPGDVITVPERVF